jgi:hypothetical protein
MYMFTGLSSQMDKQLDIMSSTKLFPTLYRYINIHKRMYILMCIGCYHKWMNNYIFMNIYKYIYTNIYMYIGLLSQMDKQLDTMTLARLGLTPELKVDADNELKIIGKY